MVEILGSASGKATLSGSYVSEWTGTKRRPAASLPPQGLRWWMILNIPSQRQRFVAVARSTLASSDPAHA